MLEVFSVYELKDYSHPDSDVYLGSFPNKHSAEDFIDSSDYGRENYYWEKETIVSTDDLFRLLKLNRCLNVR